MLIIFMEEKGQIYAMSENRFTQNSLIIQQNRFAE